MPKDKDERPAWIVRKHANKYRVIETESGWVWRTLDTPAQAARWIKDATAEPKARRA